MGDIKFCKDCKHFTPEKVAVRWHHIGEVALCTSPRCADVITGRVAAYTCEYARRSICKEGIGFEPATIKSPHYDDDEKHL